MSDEDLCYLTATQALDLFREGTLSPVELTEAQIRQSERWEPAINAFTDCYFDAALDRARLAEVRYRNPDQQPLRPLEGICLAVKDAQRVAGQRTTHGSMLLENNVDEISDPMIERLQEAGAIIHARSTTPEFCLSSLCESRLWGRTLNPFNPAFGPGGSSGGSAAALAAGTAMLATGTDIGGSIRIPASCCGVVGYKPPKGRNPDGPPASLDPYNHCGPLARSVADVALMQNVVSGWHPRDHASLREAVRIDPDVWDVRGMKIAYSMDLGYVPVTREVCENTRQTLDILRDLGAEVEEVNPGWTQEVDEAAMTWFAAMHFGRDVLRHARRAPDRLTDYALQMARDAEALDPDAVPASWDVQERIYRAFSGIMSRNDAFICPTTAIPALPAEGVPERGVRVDGKPVHPEYGWLLTHQFNMLFNCPVLAIPSGRAADGGVPTGIQIVGRTFDDATVFRVGRAIEKQVGTWFAPADRPHFGERRS